ncbi:MAG: fimbrillin family protein [Rikenellaceae bacterium]|nr:fimbrillin family protein [Rikenellaceae bacterium]MDE7355841.1 fimbrillin family protein [Rikenellaceae bacterium]
MPTVRNLEKGSYTTMTDNGTVTADDKDEFGVFMYQKANSATAAPGTPSAANVKFIYTKGSNIMSFDPAQATQAAALTWENLINGTGTNPYSYSFYSYYPYSATATSATAIPVEVPEAQIQGKKNVSGAYTNSKDRTVSKYDFLFSKNISEVGATQTIDFVKATVPADRTVRFDYSHALSIVEFNFVKADAITQDVWFSNLKLSGTQVYKQGNINITDESPEVVPTTTGTLTTDANNAFGSAGRAKEKLVTTQYKNDVKKAIVRYQMLVFPAGVSTLGDVKLEVGFTKGTDAAMSNLNLSHNFVEGTAWEPGKRYKYNVIANENSLMVELLKIDEWQTEDMGDIVVTPGN